MPSWRAQNFQVGTLWVVPPDTMSVVSGRSSISQSLGTQGPAAAITWSTATRPLLVTTWVTAPPLTASSVTSVSDTMFTPSACTFASRPFTVAMLWA